MTSTITRCFQFLAWLAVSFAFVVVVLINVGGVDPYSTQPGQNPILRNQGFELASWYLNGEDKISISNYFHYRLYLNSVCAINPSLQRGSGNCFQHGVLGSFLLSHNEPNAYVRIENPYDPILGRLNFTTAFAFYFLTAATLALLIFILPFGFLAGPSSSKVPRLRQYICLVSASISSFLLLIASCALHSQIMYIAHRLQSVPEVTNIWRGNTPLGLTWAATISMFAASILLSIDTLFLSSKSHPLTHRRQIRLLEDATKMPPEDIKIPNEDGD